MSTTPSIYEITTQEINELAKLAIEAKSKAYCRSNYSHIYTTLLSDCIEPTSPKADYAQLTKAVRYGPYTNFRVGAAVLHSDPVNPSIYTTGANVEIASTPIGICAERCAIAPIVASIKRPYMPVIRAIAVSTDIWPPSSPCGMCRQFIREFSEPQVKIYMYGRKPKKDYATIAEEAEEENTITTIGELLPYSFGPNDMDKRTDKTVSKIA